MKVQICPITIYGASTCLAPNIIRVRKLAIKIQKRNLLIGLNAKPLRSEKSTYGKTKRTTIAANIAITPNNLFGIERNIA